MIRIYEWTDKEGNREFFIENGIQYIILASLSNIGLIKQIEGSKLTSDFYGKANFTLLGEFANNDDVLEFAKYMYPEDFI